MPSSIEDLDRSRGVGGSSLDAPVARGSLIDQVAPETASLWAIATGVERFFSHPRWEAAAGDLLALLGDSVAADRVALYRWFRDADGLALSHAWPGRLGDPPASYDLGRLGLDRVRSVMTARSADILRHDDEPGPETRLLMAEGVQGSLLVPVRGGEDVWGVLRLDVASGSGLGEIDLALVRAMATLIGASIQREESDRRAREADERYRTLVEQVPAIVYNCEAGEDGRWLYVSPHINRVLGIEPRAWLEHPNPLRTFLHPDDVERVIMERARLFTSDRSLVSEYRLVAPDGRTVWIVDRFSAIGDDYGMPRWLHGVMTDVTEVRHARAALAAADAKYQALVERLPVAVYVDALAPEAAPTLYASPVLERITGYPAEVSASGHILPERLHEGDRARVLAAKDRHHRTAAPFSEEYRLIARDREIWVRDEAVVITDADGRPLFSQGFLEDVTERKRADEERTRLRSMMESERRIRELLDEVNLFAVGFDVEGRITYCNGHLRDEAGWGSERLEGMDWFELSSNEDVEGRRARFGAWLASGGAPMGNEGVVVTVAGDRRVVRWSNVAIHDRRGVIAGAMAIGEDITEGRRAEESLREAERKYRSLVETIPAIVYMDPLDPEPVTALYVSPQSRAILGYEPEEWLADAWFWIDHLHPDDREAAIARANEDDDEAGVYRGDYRMIAKDGRVVWLRDEAVLVRDASGSPLYWQGFLTDTTEQRAAEWHRRQAEEMFQQLVEWMPAITYLKKPDASAETGAVDTWISPQISAMLGWDPDEWLKSGRWMDVVHPDDRDRIRGEMRLSSGTGTYSAEHRVGTAEGRALWVRDHAILVTPPEGDPFWLGMMIDVSETKAAEEDLRQALATERAATERLRALDEMKDAFLTAISHELRTPVQVIMGVASTLSNADRMGLSIEDRARFATTIEEKSRRLAELLRDLVDVDRLNRGIVRFDPRPARIDEIIEAVVADVDILADHILHTELEPTSAPVDRALLERVIENLLANAARHTPADTDVWIRLMAQPHGALLVVEDSGPGVPPEKRELIFAPFGQGEVPAHSPGLGVGLSLVARLVQLHGGRVWVEDRPGGGASFRLLLPNGATVASTLR